MHILDNVILMMFLSFIVGIFVDPLLRRITNYQWLSSHYIFRDSKSYEAIGVLWFRRFLKITPFGSFNKEIHFTSKRDLDAFISLRDRMASSEISHWVGFIALLILTLIAWWIRGPIIGLAYVFFNILGNVYPALLQQYNKQRLARLISAAEKRAHISSTPAKP